MPIERFLKKRERNDADLKKKKIQFQTVSVERGEEHCVPAGGLLEGSYVRLVSFWQQCRAPDDSVILLINTHQLEVSPQWLLVCVLIFVSTWETWKLRKQC